MDSITLSFVVPYRDREVERIERCLRSLENQRTTLSYDIVFIDYGSEPFQREQAQQTCQKFSKVSYFYYNSYKQLWSRAHAVNLGIRRASGKYIVVVDIDLIYAPHFIQALGCKLEEGCFVQYQCYYLPANFLDYTRLQFDKKYSYPVSSISESGGLIAVPRHALEQIGGFDQYFQVWGVEDMDLKKRLRKIGLVQKVLSIEEAPTFHQWHPSACTEEQMPSLWLKAMEKYERRKTSLQVPYLNHSIEVSPARPALYIKERLPEVLAQGATLFTFEYPTLQSYVLFSKVFCALPSGGALIVQQTFESIQANGEARLAKFFKWINSIFTWLSISYRITEYATYESELVNFHNVRDFLFYFIADNRDKIIDYVFESIYLENITCILVKK